MQLWRPEPRNARIPVWALPISLAATLGIDVSFFSSGYLDVSVRRVPFHALWIGAWMPGVFPGGFPHSEIRGSMDICSSPRLFAACHVFRRLLVPRHPPCALCCLTCFPKLFLGSTCLSPSDRIGAALLFCLELILMFDVCFHHFSIWTFQGTIRF